MKQQSTREAIINTADKLFYERGFERTSFADIAVEVAISRGNFWHHFKSKDAILDAVIEARLQYTQAMLDKWSAEGATPAERIKSFICMMSKNQTKIMKHGCPVGTLCSELARLNHVAQEAANSLFRLFRIWLARQFAELGYEIQSDTLAMHLLGRSQGIASLANAFHDAAFLNREVQHLDVWIDGLAATVEEPDCKRTTFE